MLTSMRSNKVITGAGFRAQEVKMEDSTTQLLKVLITPDQLVYLISEATSGKLILLQPFQLARIINNNNWVEAVSYVVEKDDLLKREFKEKNVFVFTGNFTLVPNA